MRLPAYVLADIERFTNAISDYVEHVGIFGSLARGQDFELAQDIDVLIVYSSASFRDLCHLGSSMKLSHEMYFSYLNYSKIDALKPTKDRYFDFLFMPKCHPNLEFMRVHDGRIVYLGPEFVSWKAIRLEHEERMVG